MIVQIRQRLLIPLLACCCFGVARAEIVPISRFSVVRAKGNADGKTYDRMSYSEALTSWHKTELGFAQGTGDDFATGSAAQAVVLDIERQTLQQIALESESDGAQRGGAIQGISEFVLDFEVRKTPANFVLSGDMESIAPNSAAIYLRDLSQQTSIYSLSSQDSTDPYATIWATGSLKPGRYELNTFANVNSAEVWGSMTTLNATVQFSQPAVAPLPAAAIPGIGMLAIVILASLTRRPKEEKVVT